MPCKASKHLCKLEFAKCHFQNPGHTPDHLFRDWRRLLQSKRNTPAVHTTPSEHMVRALSHRLRTGLQVKPALLLAGQ